jgi:hypothetical protein
MAFVARQIEQGIRGYLPRVDKQRLPESKGITLSSRVYRESARYPLLPCQGGQIAESVGSATPNDSNPPWTREGISQLSKRRFGLTLAVWSAGKYFNKTGPPRDLDPPGGKKLFLLARALFGRPPGSFPGP